MMSERMVFAIRLYHEINGIIPIMRGKLGENGGKIAYFAYYFLFLYHNLYHKILTIFRHYGRVDSSRRRRRRRRARIGERMSVFIRECVVLALVVATSFTPESCVESRLASFVSSCAAYM